MSHNQSRSERSESTQYRKTGRSGNSNQQRQNQGSLPTKGGGGASSATLNPGSRSFKKYGGNAQGGFARTRSPNVDSDSLGQSTHSRGVSDASVQSNFSNAKLIYTTTSKVTGAAGSTVPPSNVSTAAPVNNTSAINTDLRVPTTPAKAPEDASKSFHLQFGSISPGFMNGVQIPARTSSAPPNLDEQKRAQARQDSSRVAPAIPTPPIPKQHLPKKDGGNVDQTIADEAQLVSKSKRDAQLPDAPSVTQTQKPTLHPIPSMPMQLPFHQPQVPLQFGSPSPQVQPQALPGTSLPLPIGMPLPIGNPPMQQPMFISGIQPHPMQSQGMMHQAQNFNLPTQMTHQIPPQMGNMGISMGPQYPHQQAGKYGVSRKIVKITHPETHEELKLDGSPGIRSHPNLPPQSQAIPSFPPSHPMNFYPNSYNATSVFFPVASSVSMNSTQVPPTSQPPRLHSQVTVKPPLSSHVDKDSLSATSSRPYVEESIRPKKEADPSSLSALLHSKTGFAASVISTASSVISTASSVISTASSGSIKMDIDAPNTPSFASAFVNNSASAPVNNSASAPVNNSASASGISSLEARNGAVVPDSSKDKPNKLGHRQQDQAGKQSAVFCTVPSQLYDDETVKTESTLSITKMASETSKESPQTTLAACSTATNSMTDNADEASRGLKKKSVNSRQSEVEVCVQKEQVETEISGTTEFHENNLVTSLGSLSLESPEITDKIVKSSDQVATSSSGDLLGSKEEKSQRSLSCSPDVIMNAKLAESTKSESGENVENSLPVYGLSVQDDKISSSDTLLELIDNIGTGETTFENIEAIKPQSEELDKSSGNLLSPSSTKDKVSDVNLAKNVVLRGKKKKKEFFRKAEAAGTSSDLYMAYKGPEEKIEIVGSVESMEKTPSNITKQSSGELPLDNDISHEKPALGKVEPDDWEDAAEISPQLESSRNKNLTDDGNGLMTKRYSRDFLLKFADQCIDLPEGFEVTSDIADLLVVSSSKSSRDSYPSPGRSNDRPVGGARLDRHASGFEDDEKWNKFPGALTPGRGDMRGDVGYSTNVVGFRPGQGGNYGVTRNQRPQIPLQYAGGLLSGPMQSLGPQGGPQRNHSDSDRWQRGLGFQRGIMPSPQTPKQMMHKAEKKYEVGKVSDVEEAKQRQLKAILNKLTPQNFEKLFQQVKEVNIDNVVTLSGVISQIFDKALMEPTFCEMYADFCLHLAADLPDLTVDNQKITFKRLLLNKCQEEFENREREEEEANKAEEEGESKDTPEEREEKRLRIRRRMLGNIRLIGELYKKRMLTERIMHECINKLLGQSQNPDAENIEALCKLMSTIGEIIDHQKAKDHMDAYFQNMARLSNNMKLSSRVRFMLKDTIDLRRNKWQQRRKVEGPKKIEEVHRDAAQERHAQTSRLARVPSLGNSMRRGHTDFAPRAPSMVPSTGSHMSSFHPGAAQIRGYGYQDPRMDERHSYESRTVLLPQRPPGDDSITLGPQGGLVRGMAFRGQTAAPSVSLGEVSSPGELRRMGPGLNGTSSVPERTSYGQREDTAPSYVPERFDCASDHDQLHTQHIVATYGNREVRNMDRSLDRSHPTSPPARVGPAPGTNVSSEKELLEEHLREKSLTAIKEFYSATDKEEVVSCIKELNNPSFYPSMISIWLADSFERKDRDRDLLTNLLIDLMQPQDGLINLDQAINGFESVLALLEDAVNDAPLAGQFLGRMFGRIIAENVVSFSDISRLIYEGGEEPGRLVEIGLAAEVVGWILETIQSENGDSVFHATRSSSSVQLESFRPPGSNKSSTLDKFIRG